MSKAISKVVSKHPSAVDRFTALPSGIGRGLKDLRNLIDLAAFGLENGIASKLHYLDQADIKVAGRTGDIMAFLGGWPEGYEKATKSWTYTTGKQLIVTAIKPGELGELIRIVFASDPNDSVTVDGMTITIKIDNDGATTPAHLQTLVAADARASGMIKITSTDATTIPNAFALAGPSGYLAGGTGLGLGFDIQNNQVWGNTAAIAFVAKQPGLAAAKYEVAWLNTGTLGVTATRKRVTITFNNNVTTVAAAVAAVNANKIVAEHLAALAAGNGAGALTGLGTKVYKLGLDFGTMVQVGDVMATITAVARDSFTYTYGAQVGVAAAATAVARARLGLIDLGSVSAPTIA